jgi:hypothetical protein
VLVIPRRLQLILRDSVNTCSSRKGGDWRCSVGWQIPWRYDRPANGNGINITTPVYHEGTVFAASAYGGRGQKLSKDDNEASRRRKSGSRNMQTITAW